MKETFKVYLSRKDEVEKSLVKLSKKATKYRIPFSWQWGDVAEERVQVLVPTPCQTPNGGVATMLYPVHKYWVQAQELTVDMEPIHEHGWSILAHIERLEGSDQRLVTLVTATETDPLWRVWDMRCDHCGTHLLEQHLSTKLWTPAETYSLGRQALWFQKRLRPSKEPSRLTTNTEV